MPFARLVKAVAIITLKYQSGRVINRSRYIGGWLTSHTWVQKVEVKLDTAEDPKIYGHVNNHQKVHEKPIT